MPRASDASRATTTAAASSPSSIARCRSRGSAPGSARRLALRRHLAPASADARGHAVDGQPARSAARSRDAGLEPRAIGGIALELEARAAARDGHDVGHGERREPDREHLSRAVGSRGSRAVGGLGLSSEGGPMLVAVFGRIVVDADHLRRATPTADRRTRRALHSCTCIRCASRCRCCTGTAQSSCSLG